jgi:copper chaperone CopZ
MAGLLIAGLIAVVIPDDFFMTIIGTGIGSMLIMMLFGIPLYVCATASVPIAVVLMAKGVSAGAALVFLMSGPSTNAATITTLWHIMGKRSAIIYLSTVIITSLGAGLLLDYIFEVGVLSQTHQAGWMLPDWIKTICAVGLIGVLANAVFNMKKHKKVSRQSDKEQMLLLAVSGMTCNHCSQKITDAVNSCKGVRAVQAHIKNKTLTVYGKGLDVSLITASIEKAGFSARVTN